jgi:hypothetical protein
MIMIVIMGVIVRVGVLGLVGHAPCFLEAPLRSRASR